MPYDPSSPHAAGRRRDAAADEPTPARPIPSEPAVIEWGDDTFSRRPPRRRTALDRLDPLRGDRRVAPLAVAALGMAAVFGSLVVQWGRITIRSLGPDGGPTADISAAVTDLGGLGAGYVIGVLGVTGLAALAIFGTPLARSNARIAGAATAGGVLVVLIAATVSLDAAVRRTYVPIWPQIDLQVAYGRGLVLAYLATAAMGLALYLAGRSDGGSPAAGSAAGSAADSAGESAAEPGTATDEVPPGSIGRPRSLPDQSRTEADVRDVTVRPTAPFARPEWEDRYRP